MSSAKSAQSALAAHAPLTCTVCGAARPFVAYRTKEGKRADGSPCVARWPEYALCPNLGDVELHPHSARRPVVDALHPVLAEACLIQPLKARLIGPARVLLQANREQTLAELWPEMVAACQRHFQRPPRRVLLDPEALLARAEELAALPAEVEVQADQLLTPGYGYLLLE